tara:strand:- start:11579 stop:11743 length:165 start_codon:yes stop_codon:yes gene_type:complete
MLSCAREIIELALKANSGITITSITPKEIIIEEEILISHLVIGSNSISKNKYII